MFQGDLVEFYYLWKKTPSAATNRPHRRHRRQNVLKKIRGGSRASRPQSTEFGKFRNSELLFLIVTCDGY